MKNWIIDHIEGLVIGLVAVGIVVVIGVVVSAPDWPDADPTRNNHARLCVEAGNTVRHHNHGGRDQSKTYWCVDSDQRITDLWFA